MTSSLRWRRQDGTALQKALGSFASPPTEETNEAKVEPVTGYDLMVRVRFRIRVRIRVRARVRIRVRARGLGG